MILLGRFLEWLRRHVFNGLGWWDKYWLRIHLASTAIGGVVLTYFLSGASLTDIWDTSSEFKAAATLAPLAVLIYTAFAAMLETGVMAMVLAIAVAGKFIDEFNERQRKRKEREEYLMALGEYLMAVGAEAERRRQASGETLDQAFALMALGAEAERQRQASGETLEQAVARLIAEGWLPGQS